MTQSVALMMGDNAVYSTKFPQLDNILDGGLKQGFILEISGPPGSIKETLAANIVSSFVEASMHVLFVGMSCFRNHLHTIVTPSDMQNMTSPATLDRSLRSEYVIGTGPVGTTDSYPV